MTAQRGDFDSPPASSPTDRRDADDATFAAELARLDRLEVADVAADVREQADALLSRTRAHMAWRGSRGGSLLSEDFAFLAGWDAARAAIAALKPAPGTDAQPTFEAALAAPGAQFDTKGEVLPHLLAFGPPPELRMVPCHCAAVHIGPCNLPVRTSVQVTPAPGTDTPDQAAQRVHDTELLRDEVAQWLCNERHGGNEDVWRWFDEAHRDGWRTQAARLLDGPLARLIPAAVAGPQRDHEARAREVLLPEVFAAERDRFAAPGTDSSGQAAQRVLDWPELIRRTEDGGWDGGWTWTECIHCGSAEVVERGLILEDGPAGALRRVAWCDRPSCASDEMLTDYLPTPRATSDFLRAVAGPQRDHGEEGGQ